MESSNKVTADLLPEEEIISVLSRREAMENHLLLGCPPTEDMEVDRVLEASVALNSIRGTFFHQYPSTLSKLPLNYSCCFCLLICIALFHISIQTFYNLHSFVDFNKIAGGVLVRIRVNYDVDKKRLIHITSF